MGPLIIASLCCFGVAAIFGLIAVAIAFLTEDSDYELNSIGEFCIKNVGVFILTGVIIAIVRFFVFLIGGF